MAVLNRKTQTLSGAASRGAQNAGGSTGTGMPSAPRPYAGLHFWVEIDGIQVASFSECSAISAETEFFEYVEGGLNTYTHKMPVRTKYANITLKRGMDSGQDLYRWYAASLDGNAQRKNVSISLYTSVRTGGNTASIQKVKQYNLRRAYPVKWTGPDLKTDAGATAVETLEFAFEGMTVETS